MFKVYNKTYQPLVLMDGMRIKQRDFILVEIITQQVKALEIKGLVLIKKL